MYHISGDMNYSEDTTFVYIHKILYNTLYNDIDLENMII